MSSGKGRLSAGLLLNGGALPVTILQRNPKVIAWHPDDYVFPESAVAKAPRECAGIVASSDYAETFEYFEKLLQERGAKR